MAHPTRFIDETEKRMRILNGESGTEKKMLPKYIKDPSLLGRIVADVAEIGRLDLACKNNLLVPNTVSDWLAKGKNEIEICDREGYEEFSILGQFYLEIEQAKSLWLTGRIRNLMECADSEDEALRDIYKNFKLWILENVDEEKRFAKWNNVNIKSEEKKQVEITVKYANGEEWTNGGLISSSVENEIAGELEDYVDTKMIEA